MRTRTGSRQSEQDDAHPGLPGGVGIGGRHRMKGRDFLPMKDSEANTLRCTAHEIIIRLMNEGETDHVRLLKQHADAAMERLEPHKPSGIDLITAERDRQINREGWTPEHDDEHADGELAMAASCYAAPRRIYVQRQSVDAVHFEEPWPWEHRWDKRFALGERKENPGNMLPRIETLTEADRIDLLVKAGALIAAEIDRLQRAK